jgi:2,3-bisphosphoglycerate-independent phosphoglycerate mutase
MAETPKRPKPLILIIRDGWGQNPHPVEQKEKDGNAVLLANTPVQKRLDSEYPHTLLTTSGEAVGLPEGQMGNSEVGHLNIGAGRIVYQDFTRINLAIRDRSFFSNHAFLALMDAVKAKGTRLHLMGLCSDGGVHSHINHLFALLELAKDQGLKEVVIHCFMDGRDTSPTGGAAYLAELQNKIKELGIGKIATVVGRYFAMDRDKRWDRTAKAYNAVVNGEGRHFEDPVAGIKQWYAENVTDEFIPPTVITSGETIPENQKLEDGDGVIFYNFRSDRARQLILAMTAPDFTGFDRGTPPKVSLVTMTEYDETYTFPIAFPTLRLTNILGEVIARNGLHQLRSAETEKYPHVTYFFNGGEEVAFEDEDRSLTPSPKVATYDLKPEMSAYEVTDDVLRRLQSNEYDVVILNFANADMVGHTGVIPAAIKAVETVDECVGKIVDQVLKMGGVALVTADHGNAEQMLDEQGKPYTAHTTYQVPFIYVGNDHAKWKLKPGILADIAPTMLQILGLPQPDEMTGTSLLTSA